MWVEINKRFNFNIKMWASSLSRCSLAATEIGTSSLSSSHHIYRFDRGDASILLGLLPRKGKQDMIQGSSQGWDKNFFQPFDFLVILLFWDFNCELGNSAYAYEIRWMASYKRLTCKLLKMSSRVRLYGKLLDNTVVTRSSSWGRSTRRRCPAAKKLRWGGSRKNTIKYQWLLASRRASAKYRAELKYVLWSLFLLRALYVVIKCCLSNQHISVLKKQFTVWTMQ